MLNTLSSKRETQHLSICIISSSQSSHPPACQGQRLRKRREIRGEITREDSRHYCPSRGEAGGTNNEGGPARIQGRSNLSTNRPKLAREEIWPVPFILLA